MMDLDCGTDWVHEERERWIPIGKKLATLKKDNPENICLLLESFVRGIRFSLNRITTIEKSPPKLLIDLNLPARTKAGMYEWDAAGERIVLSGMHLTCQAWLPPHEKQEITYESGEVLFVGTAPDRFTLLGVEEGDHAVFHRNARGNDNWDRPKKGTPVALYDAAPEELHALESQLEAAHNFNMSPETQSVIRTRILNAKKLIIGAVGWNITTF